MFVCYSFSASIDPICVTRNLKHSVVKSYIIDSGANLSDHLPICIEIKCDFMNSMNDRREIFTVFGGIRLMSCRIITLRTVFLSQIPVSDELLNCLKWRSCNA